MIATRVEALVRSLDVVLRRRAALGGLLGTVLIAGLDGLEIEDGEAKRKKKKKKKKRQGSDSQNCAATCAGCCDGSGACQAGTDNATCGAGGVACAVCTGEAVCSGGTCAIPPCGGSVPCRVFVTSTTHKGNLGGLSGADAICQATAVAAGLPGAYKVWLSDNTGSPSTRFVQSTGLYRRIDGVTVADSFTDLIDGSLDAPIIVTETGGAVSAPDVVDTWTSTQADGTRASGDGNCNQWINDTSIFTGAVGSAVESNSSWSALVPGTTFCFEPRRLYCFQQS